MTKEEQKAVEEFTEMNLTKKGLYHYNDMQDAFLIGLFKGEKMQPCLPSNLDEAAKKIAYGVCKQLPNGTEKDSIVYYAILAAKAGAQWKEKQMMDGVESGVVSAVYKFDNIVTINVVHGSLNTPLYISMSKYKGLKEGDKVKIIIVKEDEQ